MRRSRKCSRLLINVLDQLYVYLFANLWSGFLIYAAAKSLLTEDAETAACNP